jgi:hypothetical protein
MPSATVKVNAYQSQNPDARTDVDLELVGDMGHFSLEKLNRGKYRSIYEIHIPETEPLGFETEEKAGQRIQDLITSINLSMTGATVTRRIIEMEEYELEYTEEEKEEYGIGGLSADMTVEKPQKIDEAMVANTFAKVAGLERFDEKRKRGLKESNVVKSLILFDNAMQQMDRDIQEFLLYSAGEVSTLFDGSDKRGPELDTAMSNLTGVDEDIYDWRRNLVNRQKHADRGEADIQKSEEIYEKLDIKRGQNARLVEGNDPSPKQVAAIKAIKDRLRKLVE